MIVMYDREKHLVDITITDIEKKDRDLTLVCMNIKPAPNAMQKLDVEMAVHYALIAFRSSVTITEVTKGNFELRIQTTNEESREKIFATLIRGIFNNYDSLEEPRKS